MHLTLGTLTSATVRRTLPRVCAPCHALTDAKLRCVCAAGEPPRGHTWTTILKRTRLGPHAQHRFKVAAATPVSHLRLLIFPDGGVSRLRAFGTLGPVSKL